MNEALLLQQFESREFVLKTQQQISKDFAAIGCPFHSDFEQTPLRTEVILEQIQFQLNEVQKQSSSLLHQLIYQIDLPENVYIEALSSEDPTKQLAEIILRREAYKVYLRSRF